MAVAKSAASTKAAVKPMGRPPKPRPARSRMREAGKRGDLAIVEALIETLLEAIDEALPSELAALSKQLMDAQVRRRSLKKSGGGVVERAQAEWVKATGGRAGAVAPVAAIGSGRKRRVGG